jgi:hypothetical protein
MVDKSLLLRYAVILYYNIFQNTPRHATLLGKHSISDDRLTTLLRVSIREETLYLQSLKNHKKSAEFIQ